MIFDIKRKNFSALKAILESSLKFPTGVRGWYVVYVGENENGQNIWLKWIVMDSCWFFHVLQSHSRHAGCIGYANIAHSGYMLDLIPGNDTSNILNYWNNLEQYMQDMEKFYCIISNFEWKDDIVYE